MRLKIKFMACLSLLGVLLNVSGVASAEQSSVVKMAPAMHCVKQGKVLSSVRAGKECEQTGGEWVHADRKSMPVDPLGKGKAMPVDPYGKGKAMPPDPLDKGKAMPIDPLGKDKAMPIDPFEKGSTRY